MKTDRNQSKKSFTFAFDVCEKLEPVGFFRNNYVDQLTVRYVILYHSRCLVQLRWYHSAVLDRYY